MSGGNLAPIVQLINDQSRNYVHRDINIFFDYKPDRLIQKQSIHNVLSFTNTFSGNKMDTIAESSNGFVSLHELDYHINRFLTGFHVGMGSPWISHYFKPNKIISGKPVPCHLASFTVEFADSTNVSFIVSSVQNILSVIHTRSDMKITIQIKRPMSCIKSLMKLALMYYKGETLDHEDVETLKIMGVGL